MFVKKLNRFLRELDTRGFQQHQLDEHRLRRHLLARLVKFENVRARRLQDEWTDQLPELIEFISGLPSAQFVGFKNAEDAACFVLDAALGVVPKVGRKAAVDRREAERLLRTYHSRDDDYGHYALENELAGRTVDGRIEVKPLGSSLMRLNENDAVRWLLTIETELSSGVWDDWRASRETLHAIAAGLDGADSLRPESETVSGYSLQTLRRMGNLGVSENWFFKGSDTPHAVGPSAAGKQLIVDVLRDGPWRSAIRALLTDETARVLNVDSSYARAASEQSRIVTHEVRNALVPVRHHAKALAENSDVAVRERGEKVLRGVNRVLHFVEDLVAITEAIEAPRLPTSVESFLGDTIDALEQSERVDKEFAPGEYSLPRERLSQALRNVVQNALQLSAARVSLRVTTNENDLVFTVDDRGPGVAVELRERIFEDGFTTRPGGSGFGLAMTRKIMTALGGSVRCEPSDLGGARFVLALPLEPKP